MKNTQTSWQNIGRAALMQSKKKEKSCNFLCSPTNLPIFLSFVLFIDVRKYIYLYVSDVRAEAY